jgi:hypothetical protein
MFLTLATEFASAGGIREDVFRVHPIQLSRWLDEAWQSAALVPGLPIGSAPTGAPFLGDPAIVAALGQPVQLPAPALMAGSGIVPPQAREWQNDVAGPNGGGIGLVWDHLIYSYLIESTGAFEIFAELVRRLVAGESLGALSIESTQWLRATEELFFRDPPLFSITGISSEARPFARITRRNAYWRMFGLDLPHPPPAATQGEGVDWKAHTGGINTDFLAKWTELLRQVWMGLENVTNTSGAKPTDDSYIALLCEALQDMMNNRRLNGLLAREEFVHVTVLSWFHLTLQTDTPIVRDLKAEATGPADRLARLAARVGMRPAARSRELFDLAQPMSAVLRAIELGSFSAAANAATLYAAGTALAGDMRDLINQWQSATGTRVKDRMIGGGTVSISGAPTAPQPAPAQPLRIPTPGAPAQSAPSMNGTGVLSGTIR